MATSLAVHALHHPRRVSALGVALALALSGCNEDLPLPVNNITCRDPNPHPSCRDVEYGPRATPFALRSDPVKDPLASDTDVMRDDSGHLRLDGLRVTPGHVWIPTYTDAGGGRVSKLDSKAVREVARYPSVTCYSLPGGSRAPCDGTSGCCAADDPARYSARKQNLAPPRHQAVQLGNAIAGRTAVDQRGDLFVANNALIGQSSVTRIANDPADCIDRNHDGTINTSRDTSGNGWIETDCNGDGQLDDVASVKATPCKNGLPQEFYSFDDECLLWTTNTFSGGSRAHAIDLTQGGGPLADVWVGTIDGGELLRLDGRTGLTTGEAQLPRLIGAWGMAIDSSGIDWVTQLGRAELRYFDTADPARVGEVRSPPWGQIQGDGLSIDRDGNIWVGGSVSRYIPDRAGGFQGLGNGWWTRITGVDGLGIAADSRTPTSYFVFSCTRTGVLEIPASQLSMAHKDQVFGDMGWPRIAMPCAFVGVDTNQNVWGITTKVSTRALVDENGGVTQPRVNGPAMGNDVCPTGDSCPIEGAQPYSNFAGVGVAAGATRPSGSWQVLVRGCQDAQGRPAPTEWWQVKWEVDLPPNTTFSVEARSGDASDLTDPSWAASQPAGAQQSPLDLQRTLAPNRHPGDSGASTAGGWLLVECRFASRSQRESPSLKSLEVRYRCP